MTGETIKTLAEYIAKLHRDHVALEHPELYNTHAIDSNGTEQDQVETFWPPKVSSGANQ